MIVHVILPLALDKAFSYAVPSDLIDQVEVGKRVDVLFNRRHYTGLIIYIVRSPVGNGSLTFLTEILDDHPILTAAHLDFWRWISTYYVCTLGEVMIAALPGSFRIQSDTLLHLREDYKEQELIFTQEELDLFEILEALGEASIDELITRLQLKKDIKLFANLIRRNILATRSALKSETKINPYNWIELTPQYTNDIGAALDATKRSKNQTDALLAFYQLNKSKGAARLDHFSTSYKGGRATIKALVKKNIFIIVQSYENRYNKSKISQSVLSPQQHDAKTFIFNLPDLKPTLLYGVTGSGKTHVYSELIQERMARDQQVLFLVPEVALTVQLVSRLRETFGELVIVYNYRSTVKERFYLWKKLISGEPVIVLGARSSLFLPFTRLDLIIVDEEQDQSYKQQDPNPRYHGRDTAIYLGQLFSAQVILGTATPSLETYFNVQQSKYHMAKLSVRYGDQALPQVKLVDLRKSQNKNNIQGIFAGELISKIEEMLQANRQIIIFQNRRGFHTLFSCIVCKWVAKCHQCDVTLTYHKFSEKLHCHLCGYSQKVPTECPSCSSLILNQKGYGTERIQEELKRLFSLSKIQRLDADTTRKKSSYDRIIRNFTDHKVDILVGTQMVTKGLDFDNVGLVGIINGDSMMHYPDFRSLEYSFQILTQVSGRSGRKEKTGEVLIQSYHVTHPLYKYILNNDFVGFYKEELSQRKSFFYPPFSRLISVEIRHKKTEKLHQAVRLVQSYASPNLKRRMIGPATPSISYIKGYYRRNFLIKVEKNKTSAPLIKKEIRALRGRILSTAGLSTTRIIIDVDPM